MRPCWWKVLELGLKSLDVHDWWVPNNCRAFKLHVCYPSAVMWCSLCHWPYSSVWTIRKCFSGHFLGIDLATTDGIFLNCFELCRVCLKTVFIQTRLLRLHSIWLALLLTFLGDWILDGCVTSMQTRTHYKKRYLKKEPTIFWNEGKEMKGCADLNTLSRGNCMSCSWESVYATQKTLRFTFWTAKGTCFHAGTLH